jgi:hypothetical protein
MELIIRRYITAVDEKDPAKGNHQRYSVEVEHKNGSENYPNLGEFDLIKFVIEKLTDNMEA